MPKKQDKANSILINVGRRLKELRLSQGYTSYETFAHDHDLDRKQYWRLENGANITLTSLIRVLKIYNMSVRDFFNDSSFK